jgi:sterol desaturase/sphingolipid hydroxylase (fatty acid hydroxylase superfamily)
VPLERLFTLHKAPVWRPQMLGDLGWYFINSLLPAFIVALPLAFIARSLAGIDALQGFYAKTADLPLWARLLGAFVINDFGAYWMHRAQHHNKFLWRFHAVHHSAEHIDWLVNTRAHPIDMVLVRLAGLVPVYLLGFASPSAGGFDPVVAWVAVIGTFWSFAIHANVTWRFGPVEWLLSTPVFHHWHHSNDEFRDRNFAAIFPLYDKLFGTLHLPKQYPHVYGIDGVVSPTLAGQMIDPLIGPVRAKIPA